MARYCNKCNKKIGFFEEDFESMCQNCYEEEIKQEVLKENEEIKKQQKELEKKQQIEIERKITELKKEEDEQKKQKEERIKLENLKKHKKELLKNKIISNPVILEQFDKMIDMISIEKMSISGLTRFSKKDEEYKNKYTDFFYEILFELLIRLYCEMPDNFTLKDIDNINNFKSLDNVRLEFNVLLRGNINKYQFDFEENIDNYYKYNCKSENLLCDYNDCEKILFDYSGKYVFQNYSSVARILYGSPFKTLEIIKKYFSERTDICQDEIILIEFKEIYSYAITILYGLEFPKKMEIIKNNETFNKIYNNLIGTTDDIEYISNKLYDMYKNFYEDLFEMNMCPKNFYSLLKFFKSNQIYNCKWLNDKEYQYITSELKFTNVDDKVKLIVDKIKCSNWISSYVEQWKRDESLGCKILLINIITRVGEYISYSDIVLFLKNLYKNIDELIEWNNKQIAIKEKERLLNGDMRKEVEKEKQAVEYSNVQNGYEFEEYVANLYKKLGYTVEEVTKKSGDQRCRCYCL